VLTPSRQFLSPQDFKGFWESRFGGKKEPEQNGHANGESNGSAPKRTADLAVYEQFEQQVRTLLCSTSVSRPMHACVCVCCSLVLVHLIPDAISFQARQTQVVRAAAIRDGNADVM
jgi:hypothetical protein